jgi:hypothetical protein
MGPFDHALQNRMRSEALDMREIYFDWTKALTFLVYFAILT